MKKFLVILFALFLLASFAGTFYYLYAKSEEPEQVYATATPFAATIIKKAVATGSVVPRTEVEIKPQISGIIDRIFVEPGDVVAEGDLVARIRVIPNMVSLNNAQNRLNQAKIEHENARRDLERNRRLAADGTISQAAFQQIEAAFARAEEELQGARDNLALVEKGSTAARSASANTQVRATLSGMVLEVPVERGNSVIEANTFNDGTTIATIADMDDMIFEGKVDESEVGKLREGMDLLMTIGAIEDVRYEAVLERIAPKGIEEEGAIQFEIRAALAPAEGENLIRANYSANADIVLDRRDDVLAINESLLQFADGQPYVEVETADQVFERRDVQTGLSDGLVIEIVSGLSESDRVKDPSSAAAG